MIDEEYRTMGETARLMCVEGVLWPMPSANALVAWLRSATRSSLLGVRDQWDELVEVVYKTDTDCQQKLPVSGVSARENASKQEEKG